MRILYVEDNPANVFLVKRVAKMGQHEIVNFIDGREAIRKYDEVNPDLVLMDIQLVGETSGLEVVKELRARGVTTPIIAVTAYAMVGDKERCIEAGCNDYLAKPLPIPRLIEIFQQHDINIRKTTASMLAVTVEKITDHTPEVVKQPEPTPPAATNTPVESTPAAPVAATSTPAVPTTTADAPVIDASSVPATITEAPAATTTPVTPTTEPPVVAVPVVDPLEKPAVDSPAHVVAEAVEANHVAVEPEMEDTLPTKVQTKPLPAVEEPKKEASTPSANG
jgi:CheY-like chemotaxis protein